MYYYLSACYMPDFRTLRLCILGLHGAIINDFTYLLTYIETRNTVAFRPIAWTRTLSYILVYTNLERYPPLNIKIGRPMGWGHTGYKKRYTMMNAKLPKLNLLSSCNQISIKIVHYFLEVLYRAIRRKRKRLIWYFIHSTLCNIETILKS